MLHSEPSFSIYNNAADKGADEDYENQDSCDIVKLERSPTIGDRIEALGSGEFSFSKNTMGNTMGCIKEDVDEEEDEDNTKGSNEASPQVDFSAGIPADDGGFLQSDVTGCGRKDFNETGEYYLKMLKQEPSNLLLLRKYAQFLQSQGDSWGAEEYYFRATRADPKDGELLMQYAKLVWQLHQDRDKALSYFERAVSASPQDSHVLAAYASFLWEIDESEEEDTSQNINPQIDASGTKTDLQNSVGDKLEKSLGLPLHLAAGVSIISSDYAPTSLADDSGNVEEHHKRIIDTLSPKDYAEYLVQIKGDMKGAEEYYQRAILADPSDGEIISQYAKLVWQLHRDKDEAMSHFEQSVQASPHNSHVLAAYARFLWEAEEDEEDDTTPENHHQI